MKNQNNIRNIFDDVLGTENGYSNVIYIKGQIVKLFPIKRIDDGRKRCIATIRVHPNHPQIFFIDKVCENLLENYNIGDTIFIRGNIQSSDRDGEKTCSIFAEKILCDTITCRHMNLFSVEGIIRGINKINDTCWKYYIYTVKSGHWSVVPVVVYHPSNYCFPENVGDRIRIFGMCQTCKKVICENPLQYFYYQNYVVI